VLGKNSIDGELHKDYRVSISIITSLDTDGFPHRAVFIAPHYFPQNFLQDSPEYSFVKFCFSLSHFQLSFLGRKLSSYIPYYTKKLEYNTKQNNKGIQKSKHNNAKDKN